MKCDKCDNEATVHEVRIEAGKRREKHLCEQCAKSEGVAPQVPAPITALLSQFVTQATPGASGGEAPSAGGVKTAPCPGCGTTYGQFRQTGLLGCPKCYETFESQLTPLIARAHEGGTRHVGKVPRPLRGVPGIGPAGAAGAPTAASKAPPKASKVDQRALADRVALLRKQLNEAVAAEEYEKAAKFRDELARLQKPASGGEANP